jgi:alkaline phosphatase
MKGLFSIYLLMICLAGSGQESMYSTANAHSHNDYEKAFPFREAWNKGFGSIEADIFLDSGELIVAHDKEQLKKRFTLDSLYLQPLQQCIASNNGHVYKDTLRQLQLMIDIKTEATSTLRFLVDRLSNYPELIQCSSLRITISGNRPPSADFKLFPCWLRFDGDLQKEYTKEQLDRVEMFSDNFARYSSWNGKGRLPQKELVSLQGMINKAHGLGKKIRFWNAPDMINSWYCLIRLGVDYINTDHIGEISFFLQQLPNREYSSDSAHALYRPLWKNDGTNKPVRNVILMIGDGTGLAQWYAGYTANGGALNVFNMRHTGLSKTSSFDNYITDSAPGATAFSSGVKTNNRAVGVDHTGRGLTLLPEIIRRRKMKTAIITTGDIRDATPAAFYAHQPERSSFNAILDDLAAAPVDIIMGSCEINGLDSTLVKLKTKFHIVSSIDSVKKNDSRPVLLADKRAGLSVKAGRTDWAQRAFQTAIDKLSQNKEGFLLVVEGAQIDHGGHANKLSYAVSELLDFDKVIGEAMKFADSNGETLVIVTGDHETGGLTLTGGNYSLRNISGQFSTEDHTAIPVPVFAYGPSARLFDGVYENTAIFSKILQALNIK